MSTYSSEIDGSIYTTHPFDEYNGDGVSLTDRFAELREEYQNAGKNVLNMRTYNNSGYNHVTQTQDDEPEFGIEVEWIW
tara:strand:+ start:195 stop:431 length:237 start_codon:yes stop_codon:yes gene_type:complete